MERYRSIRPQYRIIYKTNGQWKVNNLGFRKTPFSLSGIGTKKIPISRPQIIAWLNDKSMAAALIFRDEELGDKVSIATTDDIEQNKWQVTNIGNSPVGAWEPSYDTTLWQDKKNLDLFVKKTIQVDGEGKAEITPKPVQVMEWKPQIKKN